MRLIASSRDRRKLSASGNTARAQNTMNFLLDATRVCVNCECLLDGVRLRYARWRAKLRSALLDGPRCVANLQNTRHRRIGQDVDEALVLGTTGSFIDQHLSEIPRLYASQMRDVCL